MSHDAILPNGKVRTIGYGTAAKAPSGFSLSKMEFERDAPKDNELLIDLMYCGVCHSDVHLLDDGWGATLYPCIPGHEMVGRVSYAGGKVTKFKVGDIVGVGSMIDSCRTCEACVEGEENHCQGPHGPTMTYNGALYPNGSRDNSFGGFATNIVVREEFVVKIPDGMDPAEATSFMCPGTATYSPLKRFNIKPGDKIGIVGIGGPGHLAVMLAKAMGAEVTAFTTHADKCEAALRFGATHAVVSTDEQAMKKFNRYFDHILSTIPNSFDVTPYLSLLRRNGSLTAMGLLGPYTKILNNFSLAGQGLSLRGSMIGSVKESQEVLNFAAENGIRPTIELIKIQDVNKALERLSQADVRFRFVIDLSSLRAE
jgi:alcohol dehydrogenase (NADP+)